MQSLVRRIESFLGRLQADSTPPDSSELRDFVSRASPGNGKGI